MKLFEGQPRLAVVVGVLAAVCLVSTAAFWASVVMDRETPSPTEVVETRSPSRTPRPTSTRPAATSTREPERTPRSAAIVATAEASVTGDPPANRALGIVTFADEEHAFRASGPGFFASEDGGSTWVERSTLGGVLALSFVSAEQGWASTRRGLFATSNGAATWERLSETADGEPLRVLDFVDTRTGFAADGLVHAFRTSDGGSSWSDLNSPCPEGWGINIDFADVSTGAAVCHERTSGDSPQTWFLTTADGGANWTPVSIADLPTPFELPGQPDVPETLPFIGNTGDLDVASADSILLAAYDSLYHTSDGGQTWVTLIYPVNYNVTLTAPKLFPDESIVFTAGQNEGARLYRSTDGGQTFAVVFPSLAPTGQLDFVDPTRGFGVGTLIDRGEVLTTADGGRTWVSVGRTDGTDAFDFVDALQGWSVRIGEGGYDVFTTADGGATWSVAGTITMDIASYAVDVAFVDTTSGYVIDAAGSLWFTTDGGKSWGPIDAKPVLEGAAFFADGFDFATVDTGWAIIGRLFYETNDGGRTWEPSPLAIDTIALSLVDESIGWAVGPNPDSARVLRTEDGGSTWTAFEVRGIRPSTVYAAGPSSAWIVGNSGCLYMTRDGGVNWLFLRC